MKSSVLRYLAGLVVLGVVFAGCKSMYEATSGSGSSAGNVGAPANTGSGGESDGDAGFFPEGSHDVEGAVPPSGVVEEKQEEGEQTASHFRAIKIDPLLEDTAGPKFVVHGDVDKDGLVDLVTGWNQSQPVQLHLQRRDGDSIRFESINLGGTYPFAVLAGVELGDFNGDSWLDVAVLVKDNGEQAYCGDAVATWCGMTAIAEPKAVGASVGELNLLFNPGSPSAVRDGDTWTWVRVQDNNRGWSSKLDGRQDRDTETAKRAPEWNSYSAMAVGEIDGINGPDILVCFNPATCEDECEEHPVNRLVLYANPGGNQATQSGTWKEVWIYASTGPIIKDCAIDDVDDDGDLDVIFTNPDQITPNISWARNPLFNDPAGAGGPNRVHVGVLELGGAWEIRPVGHVDANADVITVGDVDGDGYNDVMVRSNNGKVIQWFKRPTDDGTEPIFPPPDPLPDRFNFPWPVFTIKEFETRVPEGIMLGDVTDNGQVEAIVAAGGAVFWYEHDPEVEDGLYDAWIENFVVDDSKNEGETVDVADPDFRDLGTYINTVLVADIDDDGANDIVATLDRRTRSGLADDALIWFRNTKFDAAE